MKSDQRQYLPVSLDISNKNILIIGGGKIAEQKLSMLSLFTDRITILANSICAEIQLTGFKQIIKDYQRDDLDHYSIVYACTNNSSVNAQIKSDASKQGILVNVVDDPALCDFITPAIYKQDYMTVAVNSNGVNVLKSIAWRNKIKQLLDNDADLAEPGNVSLRELFAPLDDRKKYGKVYIAGFGPGDPELLTIKAYRALQQADIIFHDCLLNKEYLDNFKGEKICTGKRKNKHIKEQDEINLLLYNAALEGKNVVRIKGGDPLIFGRGGEEFFYLKQRLIDVEIIPGITSALAAAALAAIPLTQRGVSSSVAFCTGHPESSIQIPETDTIVYYMSTSKIHLILNKLVKAGRPVNTGVAIIENISLPCQRIITGTINEIMLKTNTFHSPLVLIVGDVVKLNHVIKKIGKNDDSFIEPLKPANNEIENVISDYLDSLIYTEAL
jgi:uroporphyrin-III C-methyltransferase/precorrin-2 dehydrogenase/sirohydrochlorin ferrochelatase